MGMRVDIVTLFPEMCQQVLDASIIGRAARLHRDPLPSDPGLHPQQAEAD